MKTIIGTHNQAIVYTDRIDDTAVKQIETLCCQEFTQNSTIRIMPDVHAGAGCTIGTTMTIYDKVVPNLVGVDIGCGMEVIRLGNKNIELQRLDKIIYEKIPSGFGIRDKAHPYNEEIDLEALHCKGDVNLNRAQRSIGTLGGGNHFIEANRDERGQLYLVVHSGSRHLGRQVAELYQQEAFKRLNKTAIPKALAYASGDLFHQYIHDMKIVQQFAAINRKAILREIVKAMKLDVVEQFTTIHNYIDTDCMILRKGAVSAQAGEKLLIPINMRDGSLICVGKGNPDWNYSAPHGAGRLMSRIQAKNSLTLSEFKKTMKGIYTTSVRKETLDEAPMAYKPMEEIISHIKDTVDIVHTLRPIYNFKAAE